MSGDNFLVFLGRAIMFLVFLGLAIFCFVFFWTGDNFWCF